MSRFREDKNNTAIGFDILLSYLNDAFRLLNEAYIDISEMRKSNPYKQPATTKTWHIENAITEELVSLAEDKSLTESLNLEWINESKDLKKKNRIDIDIVYQSGLGKAKRLGIECKHFINKESDAKYIKNGIRRFETGSYAAKMPIAGMLGYIEKGKTNAIVNDINSKINTAQLTPFEFKSKLGNTFLSQHDRSKHSDCIIDFKLYHFFLDFRGLIERN